MAEIRVLDTALINKIAAGEVVERPASVVKELIENALDAGARNITVEISDGGLELIRVTDDGCGIPPDQAKTAFLRHATSKLTDDDGLNRILTMGFRGEALSSIAAVSMTEMISKTANEKIGVKISVHGGIVQDTRETAGVTGTSVSVRNLFYNTPARKKFLKKPGTEGSYVADAVARLALGRWDVSFTFINNTLEVFSAPGENLRAAALAVYGRDIAGKLLDVRHERGHITVTGLAGKPEIARGNRAMGSFFINNRYIRNTIVQSAVEAAYKGKLTVGKFPVYILNLIIPPELTDVNVHPAKMEARFSRDVDIFRIIMGAVDAALKSADLIPRVHIPIQSPPPVITREKYKAPDFIPDFTKNVSIVDEIKVIENIEHIVREPGSVYTATPNPAIPDLQYIFIQPELNEKQKIADFRIIGQFFGVYWLIEATDHSACYIMDQHAAHERVLYEEIKEKLMSSGIISQRVIEPIAIKLIPAEASAVCENRRLLTNMGFELEDMYDNNIAIRSVPYIFEQPADGAFFMEIVSRLMDEAENADTAGIYELRADAVSRLACRAAVKANDRLNAHEARALIDRALRLENPFTCPHGRPVMVELTRREIEKMFKRIQ
ncbi:MAG: DNA mismatch repair endonuclease MutL [Defluviitaleaceae bacterium]|nr:DNA mismatch repair endonuclease MutL [Defluviitaleaceae bacterium]MCL2835763.1 DNA mismatch repair endonuclease MutL [Defluviitaleaceae bacterium]